MFNLLAKRIGTTLSHPYFTRRAHCAALGAIFLAMCASSASAQAALPAPSPSPSASPAGTLPEIGRVVTSDRRDEPIASASKPTFVIDRARIDSYGARTVADALADVPGLNLFSFGPFGAEVDYGIRGSTSEQTLILVDGIPVTDPTTGAVQLGQFSTIGVDRIEVVESGSSTLYGTSASGGVINIITHVPRGVYLEASDGSYDDRDVSVGAGNGTVGVSLERHVATNAYPFPTFAYSPGTTFPGGVRQFAYGDESAGRFSFDLPNVAGFTVRGRGDETAAIIGVPGSLDFPSTTATQATSYDSAQLTLERVAKASTFTIDLAGSQTRLAFVDPIENNGESDTYSGRSQLSLKEALSGAHEDAVIGIDLARESGVFTSPAAPPPFAAPASAFGASQSQSAAYLQVGASPFAGTRFTAGLRGENDSPQGSVLAPSFGGVIRTGSLRFAGDVGESFRVPTLEDLFFPGFSNPHLLPEKAQTADVTVAYDLPLSTLSAGWFDRNGSNFIVLAPPSFLPVNAQRAAVAGIQLTASTHPFAGLVAAASLTNLYRALDLSTGGRLPRNPVNQVTFSLTRPFARDHFSYGLRWGIVGSDGDDKASATPPLTTTYDAYDQLDAFVRYKLAGNTILTLRGFNLGNEQFAPVFGYPAPGRRIYLEVATR